MGSQAMRSMSLAEDLYHRAFDVPRDQRSLAYKNGVRDALRFHAEGIYLSRPYPEGSAELDAWYSGVSEGRAIWRQWRRQSRQGVMP